MADRGIEKQIRALRESRNARGTSKAPKASILKLKTMAGQIKAGDKVTGALVGTIIATSKDPTMKKPKTKKTAPKRKIAAKVKTAKAPKIEAAKKAKAPKKGIPATEVADFICRAPGASMAELEKKFGIEAHPMRAKIFYAKHKLGYVIENKDGRYSGTPPKAA